MKNDNKYEDIYRTLQKDILNGKYPAGTYLPSGNACAKEFNCTRNTVRRALSMLENEGLVLPQHGKGVQVIYRSRMEDIFVVGGIESFYEAARRNGRKIITEVKLFEEIETDEKINLETGFDIGAPLYHIERVRIVDGTPLILDRNYFLRSETPGLTKEICEHSIYQYLENTLHMNITTSHRLIQAQQATLKDQHYLDLHGLDFVLCVSGQVFNSKGIMFEYTQSRHVPDAVCFAANAVRKA